MEYKHESGLTATFDFDTAKEAVLCGGEPIYIYKDEGFTENNITMTIDEAKWLVLKLKNLIKAFENELDK